MTKPNPYYIDRSAFQSKKKKKNKKEKNKTQTANRTTRKSQRVDDDEFVDLSDFHPKLLESVELHEDETELDEERKSKETSASNSEIIETEEDSSNSHELPELDSESEFKDFNDTENNIRLNLYHREENDVKKIPQLPPNRVVCYKCGGSHFGYLCKYSFFIPKSPRKWISSLYRIHHSQALNLKRKRLFDSIKESENIEDFSKAWYRMIEYENSQKKAKKAFAKLHFKDSKMRFKDSKYFIDNHKKRSRLRRVR